MEFGTREILIVLGVLVLLAILLDGIRRVNQARSGKLRTSRRRQAIFEDDDGDDYGSELPSGGARVVGTRDQKSAEEISARLREQHDQSPKRFTSVFQPRQQQPGQVQKPASQNPPLPTAERVRPPQAPVRTEPGFGPVPEEPEEVEEPQAEAFPETEQDNSWAEEDSRVEENHQVEEDPWAENERLRAQSRDEQAAASALDREKPAQPLHADPMDKPQHHTQHHTQHHISPRDTARDTKPVEKKAVGKSPALNDEVLILHLMARKGERFDGEELLQQILNHKLRYGAMKIFHRHEREDGSGDVHFSLANALNPGTFDLGAMETFSTPGVTFIMPLADLRKPLESFDLLLETAGSMAKKLNGELKDETRSALTRQTAEHYKQRIIEFTRRSFTLTN